MGLLRNKREVAKKCILYRRPPNLPLRRCFHPFYEWISRNSSRLSRKQKPLLPRIHFYVPRLHFIIRLPLCSKSQNYALFWVGHWRKRVRNAFKRLIPCLIIPPHDRVSRQRWQKFQGFDTFWEHWHPNLDLSQIVELSWAGRAR